MSGALDHNERILLIGDALNLVAPALAHALPGAQVTAIPGLFDAMAELSARTYTAVLTSTEPIERRPEAAVRALRQLAGDGRIVLFGHSTLEPLSRKMLEFGADDYVVTPPALAELQQIFGTAPRRQSGQPASDGPPSDTEHERAAPPLAAGSVPESGQPPVWSLPLSEIVLDALLHQPADALDAAIVRISAAIGPSARLVRFAGASDPPPVDEGMVALDHPVRADSEDAFELRLLVPREQDAAGARHLLGQLAFILGKVSALQERHARLQKLAITDDLTGLYNGRYFRHFLQRVVETARTRHFPVTLLLFDIDNFKQYNDTYGHGVGDEILRQTAALMRRCVREHDLVARISGDEFAVVFWEKDGPRQPQGPNPGMPGRPPQTPLQIFQRFQRMLTTQHFSFLGPSGQGRLTISGGLAVFPWDANDPDELIAAADKQLMFGAKRAGKNAIFLVGGGPDAPSVPPAV